MHSDNARTLIAVSTGCDEPSQDRLSLGASNSYAAGMFEYFEKYANPSLSKIAYIPKTAVNASQSSEIYQSFQFALFKYPMWVARVDVFFSSLLDIDLVRALSISSTQSILMHIAQLREMVAP